VRIGCGGRGGITGARVQRAGDLRPGGGRDDGLYIIVALLRLTRRGRADAGVLLAGMGFLFLVLAFNVLQFYTGMALKTFTAFGQLCFVLSAPMVLLRRLARALTAEELRSTEQREKVDLLVRTTQAGILDWDDTRSVTRYSPRLLEILGYPAGIDTDGDAFRYFFDHIHPDERTAVLDLFRNQLRDRSLRGGETRHNPHEYRLQRRDGSPVWVHAEAISLRADDGRTCATSAPSSTSPTIAPWPKACSAERGAGGEHEAARDVERMSRHDLKTPLNSIIGVARLLQEDAGMAAEHRKLLAIAERAGYRMLEMVNLSLDLSRMELGTYDFRPQAVNLVEVISRVLVDLQGLAESSRVKVRLDEAFSRPVYARAEELLCYSILANLLKNAIEATPPGGIVRVGIVPGERVQVRLRNPSQVAEAVSGRFFDKYVTAGKSGGHRPGHLFGAADGAGAGRRAGHGHRPRGHGADPEPAAAGGGAPAGGRGSRARAPGCSGAGDGGARRFRPAPGAAGR
jgi:signal transduction histidine kinase